MSGKIALVTGATGFIGRSLCLHLKQQGWIVRIISRTNVETGPWDQGFTLNLANESPCREMLANVDTVFHLASSGDNKHTGDITQDDLNTNIHGTARLLKACKGARTKKILYFSSVKAMGEGSETCLDESSPASPITSYGISKLEAEKLVLAEHSLHPCVLRLPYVYGPSGKGNLPAMIRAIDKGIFPPLPPIHNKRSMIHVEDVVQAAMLAANRPASSGKVFIVTDGQTYSISEITRWIRQALNKKEPRWHIPKSALGILARTGDTLGKLMGKPMPFNSAQLEKLTGSAFYSNHRARIELGFQPTRTLRNSLADILSQIQPSLGARSSTLDMG